MRQQERLSTILVAFDSKHAGQEAMCVSQYKPKCCTNTSTTGNISYTEKLSFQARRSQFPLTPAWAVTIHKCQGLTLPKIVIDMTPAKGKFKPEEAYVAFSRLRTLEKI